MSNELKSLSDIFQNKLFRIPDYQRGYAWQKPQLEDFWDDLYNLQDGRSHYTGMLSLKYVDASESGNIGNDQWMIEKEYKLCHVVDGQQRLTTMIILINEIIECVRRLPENKGQKDEDILIGYDSLKKITEDYICQKKPPLNLITTYILGYEIDNPSDKYLRYRVLGDIDSSDVVETYYTKNLKRAKNFFARCLDALYKEEGAEGIAKIYKKLTHKMLFNLYEIGDDFDVFVTFETMNNRGKKLTNLELLKNRLIYITTIYDDSTLEANEKNALREQINDAWKEIYYQMGRNGTSPLLDDEYLKAHWIIYFTYSRRRGDDYISYLLNKFNVKNVYEKKELAVEAEDDTPVFLSDDDDYSDDEVVDDTQALQDPSTVLKLSPVEISEYVSSLKEMAKHWYDSFFPYDINSLTDDEKLWLERLNRIGIGYFRPLVAVALHDKVTPAERVKLFKAIERFIFLHFRVATYRSYYQSSVYYAKARELFNGKVDIKNITNLLETKSNENMTSIIGYFVTDMQNRFDSGSGSGFYSWGALRYFLFEYEYGLAEEIKRPMKMNWKVFTKSEKDKLSIEHILPQDPSKWYWRNQFRQYISDPHEMNVLTGSLGNLLPLAQSINSSLQNDSFEEKKKPTRPGRSGYSMGSLSELEVAQNADWDALLIHQRTMKMLEFMEKRWSMPMTQPQKEALAHDEFIFDGRTVPPTLAPD